MNASVQGNGEWRGAPNGAIMHKYLPSIIILLAACQEEENKTSESAANHSPGIIDVQVNPDDNVKTIDTLNCEFEATDIDGDPLAVEINWYNVETGEMLGDKAYLQLNADAVDPGDNVMCEVTVKDPSGESATASDDISVSNSEPVVEKVEISPTTDINNGTELVCNATTSDLDEEELEVEYQWKHNDEVIGDSSTVKLANHDVEPGDNISCIANISDGYGGSDEAQAEIVIGNRAPALEGVQIEVDGIPTTRSLLTCSANAIDVDGDATSMSYKWLGADNSVLGQEASLQLDPAAVAVGDVITCEVTVSDDKGGEHSEAVTVTLENTGPSWNGAAQITPNQNVEVNMELSCEASAADADNEDVNISYEWKNASQQLGTGSTLQLNQNNSSVGGEITCVATAEDPHGSKVTSAAAVTVQNTAPSFSNAARIHPKSDVYNHDLVECKATAGDANGDTVEMSYEWSNLTQQTSIGQMESLQLSSDLAAPGDEIQCIVTVSDDHGAKSQSSISLTISNAQPSFASQPVISPDTGVKSNSTLSCSAEAEDDGTGTTLSYVWKNETKGTELGKEASLGLTHELAGPNDEISCTVTATDSQNASASSTVSVVVENSAPVFDEAASISPDSNIKIDSTLDCSASVSDIDGDTPSLSYEWRNKTKQTSLGSSAQVTLNDQIIEVGDAISCTITATDTHGESTTSATKLELLNSAPYFTQNPAITPATDIKVGMTLTCNAEATDDEGTAFSMSYTWKNLDDSSLLGSTESLVLAEGEAKSGDRIQCLVEVTDTEGASTSSSVEVIVSNSAPYFSSAANIAPNAGVYNDSVLTCDAIAADADGENPALSYEWKNETRGTVLGTTAAITLDPDTAQPNDNISCKVTATDAKHATSFSGASVVVESAAPTFSAQAAISPNALVTTASVLTCDATAVDRNGQAMSLDMEWINDNGDIALGSGSSLTLTAVMAQPGDTIICKVSATASNGEISTSQHGVLVANSAPDGLVASVSPTDPVEGVDDVTCAVETDANDIDGQELHYSFEWSINDALFDGGAFDDEYTGDVLPSSAYQANDEIKCEIIVTDGEAEIRAESVVTAVAPADPLSALSDEFDDVATMMQWQRLVDTEQWAGDQMEQIEINDTVPNQLSMLPYANGWNGDFRGALLYRNVSGNFVVSTQVEVGNRRYSDMHVVKC